MLTTILPSYVAAAESFTDLPGARLLPEERAPAAAMSEERRGEFATVRQCARRAGRRLGLPPFPLPPGRAGAPRWPHGVVGSLTHCRGYRAAAVARSTRARAVGIDAEPHGPLPDGMLRRIALPEERARHDTLRAQDPGVCWDRLLFCAKEAVYKVWSPLAGEWLGFHEASIRLEASPPSFTARLLRPVPDRAAGALPPVLHGRWTADRDLLLAAVVVRR
ncbi:4'-phosphopantetheinyl transferase family protein [Streptomyces sp. NPDC000229]|uniref:4'-phosphopantetheinyl transferase family protein n=1 Tax=Streptomyces sp. NPDC000229 TaxID=3154247 RepID=UPI003325CE49